MEVSFPQGLMSRKSEVQKGMHMRPWTKIDVNYHGGDVMLPLEQ
jgi:hypothetical protein